jgi:acyl carrier protein
MDLVPERNEVLDRLRKLVSERLGVDPTTLQADSRLADIGIDSFALIELVFVAEEEFKVSIPFDGLAVASVADVLDVIERRMQLAAE